MILWTLVSGTNFNFSHMHIYPLPHTHFLHLLLRDYFWTYYPHPCPLLNTRWCDLTRGVLMLFLAVKSNPLLDAVGARRGSLSADAQPQEWAQSLFYQSLSASLSATHYSQMCCFSLPPAAPFPLSFSLFPRSKCAHCCVQKTRQRKIDKKALYLHIHLQWMHWIDYYFCSHMSLFVSLTFSFSVLV